MRGQQGNGFGARRRYLAEQNAFMAEIGHDPVSKKLKATEFESGNLHEAYSGESKRRRVASAGMGWAAASAGTGMAASAALGAGTLGRPGAQAALSAAKKKYPVAAGDIDRLKTIGQKAAKRPKTVLAGAAALGATSAVTGRIARFRDNEEAGISQGLGRIKAGAQYNTDQKKLVSKMSELKMYGIAGQLAQDPQVQRAATWALKHKKPLAATAAVGATGTVAYQGQKRGRLRRKEVMETRQALAKREPLKTSISQQDAQRLERRYGLKGPLPKGLTREQKIAAYEARYVRAGGHKAEKWQRRADRSETIRTAGVGAGAVAGAAYLGAKAGGGRVVAPLVRRTPLRRMNRKSLETTGVAVGTVTAGAEVDAIRARRKRSSYASAPGGVAASALRRLQAYTPEEKRG